MAESYKFVLMENKPSNSGYYPIYLRVTVDRKSSYCASSVMVKEKDWNDKKQSIRASAPSHMIDNERLSLLLENAKSAFIKLSTSGTVVTAADITRLIKNPIPVQDLETEPDFISYVDQVKDTARKAGRVSIYVSYNKLSNRIKKYWGESQPLLFSQLDIKFIRDLTDHLHNEGLQASTIKDYVERISIAINRAIKDEVYTGKNIVKDFQMRVPPPIKARLSIIDIELLTAYNAPIGSVRDIARDAYLFSFWTGGMRFRDVATLKWTSIQPDRVVYIAHKTKKQISIPLLDEADRILRKYDNGNRSGYVFPILRKAYSDPIKMYSYIGARNALINKFLKFVADEAGIIGEKLSFHTARHTYSDISRKMKIDLYSVSKTLGHASLSQTQAYLSSLDNEAVDDAMFKLSSGFKEAVTSE